MVTQEPDAADVARFRGVLADWLGWTFPPAQNEHLARVLRRRTQHNGGGVSGYLHDLSTDRSAAEQAALAEELTVTESYFFRNIEQFNALADVALPALVRARSTQPRLRLLSVGCSSGEEPYSLAIVARQAQPDPAWEVSVLGLDANPRMLNRAVTGRYAAWSLRETPAAVRRRWFHQHHHNELELEPAIRRHVTFQLHNVAEEHPLLWQRGRYDVIFCRNLLMYLTPSAAQRLVRRMTNALADDGYLFLGHTDTLGNRPDGLEPMHHDGAFFYRRTRVPRPAPDPARASVFAAPVGGTAPAPPMGADAPADAPAGAARSPLPSSPSVAPRGLAEVPTNRAYPSSGPAGRTHSRPPGRAAADRREPVREQVLALLREERFPEAVTAARRDGDPAPADAVLYALTLALAGQLDEAAGWCRRVLAADPRNADAHHLLGMCLEAGVEPEAAVAQYRLAAYLDGTFAMPRLRLGLLARRHGHDAAAGTELARAHRLLRRETDERILCFGGGFGRQALVTLCRNELDHCGVAQ